MGFGREQWMNSRLNLREALAIIWYGSRISQLLNSDLMKLITGFRADIAT